MLIKITIIATIIFYLIIIRCYVKIILHRRKRNKKLFEKIRRTGKHYIREGDKFVKYEDMKKVGQDFEMVGQDMKKVLGLVDKKFDRHDFMPGKTIVDLIDGVSEDDER